MQPAPSTSIFARSMAAVLALTACIASSCVQLPHRYGKNVVPLPSGGLVQASPTDVVVAPVVIVDTGVASGVPAEALRSAFQRFLPLRRYTPLAIEYVDERAVEASYSVGACDEEAVLQLFVHSWDDLYWETRGTIQVVVEARMVDATGAYSQPLWAGRLEQQMNAGAQRESHATEDRLIDAVCDEIARELLESLPIRRVQPGRE